MATHPDGPEEFKEANRQIREALKDCHELLDRTRNLLRRTGQDNDPPK